MSIICKQCGYENPDGATVCEICAEPLGDAVESTVAPQPVVQSAPQQSVPPVLQPIPPAATQAAPQPAPAYTPPLVNPNMDAQDYTVPQNAPMVDDGNEYFVMCPESQTKTILPSGSVTTFYCEGCKKQHEIDGFLWNIEKRAKAQTVTSSSLTQVQSAPKGDNLWLEEINSHVRINIDKSGGSLGRYGKYGAEFFQSRGLLMVSGEHCMFSYQYGTWVLNHISKTNQTMYNNMVLGSNEPTVLEDGKVLTLANAVSFIVRIG